MCCKRIVILTFLCFVICDPKLIRAEDKLLLVSPHSQRPCSRSLLGAATDFFRTGRLNADAAALVLSNRVVRNIDDRLKGLQRKTQLGYREGVGEVYDHLISELNALKKDLAELEKTSDGASVQVQKTKVLKALLGWIIPNYLVTGFQVATANTLRLELGMPLPSGSGFQDAFAKTKLGDYAKADQLKETYTAMSELFTLIAGENKKELALALEQYKKILLSQAWQQRQAYDAAAQVTVLDPKNPKLANLVQQMLDETKALNTMAPDMARASRTTVLDSAAHDVALAISQFQNVVTKDFIDPLILQLNAEAPLLEQLPGALPAPQ